MDLASIINFLSIEDAGKQACFELARRHLHYTKWRENLFPEVPAEEFLRSAADFRKEGKPEKAEQNTQEGNVNKLRE